MFVQDIAPHFLDNFSVIQEKLRMPAGLLDVVSIDKNNKTIMLLI